MLSKLRVENIKCGGCANSITKKLSSLEGVAEVKVNVAEGEVSFVAAEDKIESVKLQLASMGYPEQGTTHGMASAGAKAKSYVSCAIGKMSESTDA